METLQAPFPWFGGKSKVSGIAWGRFGDVKNYVEPFAGSLAVLLGRPHVPRIETVNDLDCCLANFWRAIKCAPDDVAKWCDGPVNEADLSSRHIWIVERKQNLALRLQGDADYFCARTAGYWVYGICSWIGSGWCSGKGPWIRGEDGTLTDSRQLPHLGNAGMGVWRQRPHLGDAGRGVNRKLPETARDWFDALALRLRNVRVCCGDWARVTGPSVTTKHGMTGVFLDPPYSAEASRADGLYAEDSLSVAHGVREWAIAHGDDPLMRIALCGYDGEHTMPASWECVSWKANGGYGSQSDGAGRANVGRERIWFSPHCIKANRGEVAEARITGPAVTIGDMLGAGGHIADASKKIGDR